MATDWSTKRVLIVVRTYPTPAQKSVEVSCTAGITKDGHWIRLFPIPYRFLSEDRRFKKYQWIDVSTLKARNDPRPESYKINPESIRVVSSVPHINGWQARKEKIFPLKRHCLCCIKQEAKEKKFPTLGIFKPATIQRLVITETEPQWTREQLTTLHQQDLFLNNPEQPLEKIPYEFRYDFRCDESTCNGHLLICTDWELGQSYRKWRKEYGSGWEQKFRQRYEEEMIHKYNTHFYVGTLHQYPKTWIIVGLFYPPYSSNILQQSLFSS
jgi:hypothetical protein